MSDPHLVYLFKLAKEQGIITDLINANCEASGVGCDKCPADPACSFIKANTDSYEAWLANYRTFYSRADFQPSIKTILGRHPEFLL